MGIVQILESLTKVKDDIYLTEFEDGTEVSFFLPSWRDALRYARLLSIVEEDQVLKNIVFEYIFKRYTLDSYLINDGGDLPAGITSSVVGTILHLSAALNETIEDINTLLEKRREESTNYLSHIKRTICSVFPAYKLSDVNELNYQELIEVFVDAERILLDRGIIEQEFSLEIKEEEVQETIGSMIQKDVKEYTKFQVE